jgi:hypothetical protein
MSNKKETKEAIAIALVWWLIITLAMIIDYTIFKLITRLFF